ncbi:TetR/AcrR family transcriptional regulator [Paenarthrobacter sp. NPDC091711]|uniref:TetR/AcrR family transcriptional regulator n=1 Tax=Paenarthrobacter sp. NPDC091711 TaxID=3364385 RepID=UPI0037F3DE39
MRSDTRRNIQRLLDAVNEEVSINPGSYSMASIATRAGIGTASAYRYFPSLDELLKAYMVRILESLEDFSVGSELRGPALFTAVMNRWVELVLEHGRVMVQLRSRAGFLERLDGGDSVIAVSKAIWERPLRELIDDLRLPPEMLRQALFICNALSDPREILDLRMSEDLSAQEITQRLATSVMGAAEGYRPGGVN